MMRKLRQVVFLLPLACGAAHAASLSGRVIDPSGMPVSEARVAIFARDRQERITAVTDGSGQYRVDALAPGEYLVEAAAPGMTRSGARTLTLALPDAARLDLTLGIVAVRTEVLVTATGAAQSTDEIAKSVDSLRTEDLDRNAEFSVTESLRSLPGMRIQTLGGPGAQGLEVVARVG